MRVFEKAGVMAGCARGWWRDGWRGEVERAVAVDSMVRDSVEGRVDRERV